MLKNMIAKRKRARLINQRAKAFAASAVDFDDGIAKFKKTINDLSLAFTKMFPSVFKKKKLREPQIVVDSRKWTGRY